MRHHQQQAQADDADRDADEQHPTGSI